ncbi:helix-turn-helix transcriptional regulator [Microbispora sp. NPDC046933]|uniref:helix-turn-helix transcriptional regulator n=1 Tax=Microbispora sp. NPDC046933 TaxID=3155618 RepID=UPI0033C0BAD0
MGGETGHDNRRELARFLRDRRARVAPQDMGLPVGPHRRTKGLRREEVAVLAGLSPTWYTYLEQGRDINPSPQVLDSLARVLGLSEDERRYVHRLARTRPGSVDGPVVGDDLVVRLVEAAGRGPWPLYAGNRYGDVVAWNRAATEWYTDFGRLPDSRRNMLWWLLTDPEARRRLPGWAGDALDVVARLRTAYPLLAGDARMSALVAGLREASPEFRRWWGERHVHGPRLRPRTIRAPGLGTRTFRLALVDVVDSPGHSLVFHLPAPDGREPGSRD